MAANSGAIFILPTLEFSGRPCAECGRMFMTTLTQMRSDAATRHPPFLTTPTTTPPPAPVAKGPEPCGLTPAEIRQIILEVLG